MGGKSSKVKIPRYNMSLHYGICHGPVDAIEGIYIGEKEAWAGSVTDNTVLTVNKEGLFGGIKKEGGVKGAIELMMGGSSQVVSTELANRLGDTPANLPGFRGIVSAFFRGIVSPKGFYWAASNPYLKSIWFKIRNIHSGLGGPHAAVPRSDGSPGAPDNNPAHIIYSCYTNTDWGMGEDPGRIDVAAFLAVAETLYNEGLGLSLRWTKSGTIEEFVNQIAGMINGVVFTHPRTGYITLRLIRDDYDVETLRTVTVDNARLSNFARKAWGETVNEMKVTWTNPVNENEETVYAQDLGNIAMQGALVSDSRNYFGVRYAGLAQHLANRDLRAASAPLCSAEADLDRSFWDVTPYECVKLDWPEYGIVGLIMRVTNVSYGTIERPSVKIALVEDVFALPQVAFVAPTGTSWVDPAQPPVNVSGARLVPAPAYSLIQDEIMLSDYVYPSTASALLVPSPYTSGSVNYDVLLKQTTASGAIEWVHALDTQEFAGRGELSGALPAEVTSVIAPPINATGPDAGTDYLVMIGADAAAVETLELALVTAVNPVDGYLTLMRGVLDTVPKVWTTGTRVWWVPIGLFDPLPVDLTVGQTTEVKVVTNTSMGQTDESTSPIFSAVAKSRPTRPIRPANVKMNGTAFGLAEIDTDITLTWSHRNRLLEDVAILAWDGGSITPEDGTTYRVEMDAYNGAGTLIAANWFDSDVGLVNTFTLDLVTTPPPGGSSKIAARVFAVRDGERSWQAYELIGTIAMTTGFGLNFGWSFGV